jgi:DGQHR domain-containing protein
MFYNHPGWIVDGQQRAAAIRDAEIEGFPVFVTAFITDSVAQQREQFILVNSTKPLPKGLIYELLPSTDAPLPLKFEKKRFPTYLLERLNFDSRSPFHRMIQTPTTPDGIIKDNSILRMLENSLNDGALCRFKTGDTNGTDSMLELLFNYWSAVSAVFADAWNLPPKKSRLTHGVGIMSLGYVMDAICDRHRTESIPTKETFIADLEPLKPHCSWTTGYWNFGPGMQRKWNEVQNTSKDIQLVANFLLVQYKRLVWQ